MRKSANIVNPFKVGDILHHQWHCTMIYPEYYKVTHVTPKTVTLIEVGRKTVSGDCWQGEEIPNPEETRGHERRCYLREAYDGRVVAITDSYLHHTAGLWDGKSHWADYMD